MAGICAFWPRCESYLQKYYSETVVLLITGAPIADSSVFRGRHLLAIGQQSRNLARMYSTQLGRYEMHHLGFRIPYTVDDKVALTYLGCPKLGIEHNLSIDCKPLTPHGCSSMMTS